MGQVSGLIEESISVCVTVMELLQQAKAKREASLALSDAALMMMRSYDRERLARRALELQQEAERLEGEAVARQRA